MKEYIEREKAIQALADDYAYAAADLIKKIPAADVSEIRHGKNISEYELSDEFICSECGIILEEFIRTVFDEDGEMYICGYECKFCPECGAKMDKESS